jgi:cell division protein FtsW
MTVFDLERDRGFQDWLDGARDGCDDWSVPTFRRAVEDRFAPRRPRPWSRPVDDPVDVDDATPERDPDRPEIAVRERRRLALERLQVAERPRRGPRVNLFGSKRVPFWETQKGPAPVGYYVLAVVITLFVMLGLVMVLSASAQTEAARGRSPYHIFYRQLMWAGFGTVGLMITLRLSLTWLRRLSVPLLAIAGLGMLAPFTPGLGVTVNDARAWIAIGNFSMQPSEFLKLALVIFVADLLVRRKDDLSDVRRSLKPLIFLAGLAGVTTLAQGDLGSAIVMTAIVLAVAFIGGVPLVPLLATGALGAIAAIGFVFSSDRRYDRFTAFLDMAGHKDRLSYQTWQGLLAMADGGLTGSGIGAGNGKMGYLPLAHSDFIFAVIGDELGFVGVVAVLGGFGLLAWFGIQAALSSPDRFGMLLAGGIAAWFGVQAIINTGGVSGLMPVTGLTLPFFSAGGSSLFISMTAAGLLLNVARRGQLAKTRDRE